MKIRLSPKLRITLVVVFVMLATMLLATSASSQEPENVLPDAVEAEAIALPSAPSSLLFSYQGQLLDASGNPVPDQSLPMTFKLYSVATNGTACWTENRTGANAVGVQDGLFNVLLGQITPLNTACLVGNVYLELVVNGETLSQESY